MQIRKQLRHHAFAIAALMGGLDEYPLCCVQGKCKSGYHGQMARTRWKSRARHHGNSTGQSKHAGK